MVGTRNAAESADSFASWAVSELQSRKIRWTTAGSEMEAIEDCARAPPTAFAVSSSWHVGRLHFGKTRSTCPAMFGVARTSARILSKRVSSAAILSNAHSRAPRRGPASVRMGVDQMEALIFDCDGVLADTERDAHRIAFNIAFEERGLDTVWTEEMYGVLLETGGGKERMTAHWSKVGWPESVKEDPAAQKELVTALHKRKTDVFMELIQSGKIPLRNGVSELVREAQAKQIPIAVCSTSNERAVSEIVKLLGADAASQIKVFAGDVVAKKKPAPDIYLLAKDTMKLDASRCVVIEDSHIGLCAAKAAGMKCVITKSTYTVNEDFSAADKVFNDLAGDQVTLHTLGALLH
ncbi:CBBY-like protein [Porphyridium purpureum]|uniref:CBBY-like protein n=1 Tax=Porphyridium purpureum TaxID=35688 RepID=A0A5J4YHM3_PORPP|nr:CBBY-like protein [Porphyridium purpureum]|eukprot:POR6919..scf289_17